MRGIVSMRLPVMTRPLLLAAIFLGLLALKAIATTYYVDVNSTNPTPPYADWSTASTDIQSAVNLTTNGDAVLVNDGTYQSGGYASPGGTYCVVITNAITLQSLNGTATTLICGSNSIGCVYLASNALLSGFTLANRMVTESLSNGRGVYCASTDAIVTNCVMINNFASAGGGAYSGTLINCTLQGNIGSGAAAVYSTLFNCAILGNQGAGSVRFGGAAYCTLSNCVVAGNISGGAEYCTLEDCTIENNTNGSVGGFGGGVTQSTLNNCLICGNQGYDGGGASSCELNFCIVSNNVANEGGGVYGSLQTPGQSNIVVDNRANGNGGGIYLAEYSFNLSGWTFISNSASGNGGGVYSDSSVSNCTFVGNSATGNGGGCYCSSPPAITLVSDCTFVGNVAGNEGGGAYAVLANCSVIGNRAGYGGGVYGIANNCIINSNVATTNGGGLYSGSSSLAGTVANCAFTNNLAVNGGAVYGAVLISNCVFWANSATNNGGALAGGYQATECVIRNNYAGLGGGGVYDTMLIANCLLNGNVAAYGGGAYYDYTATILDSTIANNRAVDSGGGIYCQAILSEVANCIIYDNSAPTNMNYAPTNALNSTSGPDPEGGFFCCTVPLPLAARGASNSNFTNDPAFVNLAGDDFHLQSNSPCINSGNNASVAGSIDLDGNPRIVGGTVDIGAYEYQTPVSMTSYHWLQQYCLPITTNTDTSDVDGTAFDVYQDWVAGLNPTNPASILVMLPPLPNNNISGVTVSWESVTNISYNLLRATNLTSAFTTIQANITARTATTSYTDTSATNVGPYFYRVAVP